MYYNVKLQAIQLTRTFALSTFGKYSDSCLVSKRFAAIQLCKIVWC